MRPSGLAANWYTLCFKKKTRTLCTACVEGAAKAAKRRASFGF
jgi:hypothetical protein